MQLEYQVLAVVVQFVCNTQEREDVAAAVLNYPRLDRVVFTLMGAGTLRPSFDALVDLRRQLGRGGDDYAPIAVRCAYALQHFRKEFRVVHMDHGTGAVLLGPRR